VATFGGAGYFGPKAKIRFSAPIVGGAATADGAGYWLASAKGGVYNYGDALSYGSAIHVKKLKPVVAIAPTPDGGGYWLTTARGNVYNYGDAGSCGSAVHASIGKPIVSIASTPDGGGYWLVNETGHVFAYGDAPNLGSIIGPRHGRVVSIVSSADGKGYWLCTTKGAVYNFGDAGFFGSQVHVHLPRPITSMAATIDGNGYWMTTSKGAVYNFGDASFSGSLVHHPPRSGVIVVAIARTVASISSISVPLPHKAFGYDISNYQCTKSGATTASPALPPTSALSIIEAAGWLDSANNSCLAAEASWATGAAGPGGAPYNLYVFLNSPDQSAAANALAASGPQGTCANQVAAAQQTCQAYNYGYNGAGAALAYANSKSVHSPIWWVDVENATLSHDRYSHAGSGQYWSNSLVANDLVIQGAINALRGAGITVGIYSTSVQYPKIAGNFVPTGAQIPLWIAGVPWTNPPYTEKGLASPSVLAPWCDGTAKYSQTNSVDVFAGGIPWILQETPGTIASPFGLDPDYSC
jgi:hypothetical protein